MNKDRNIRTLAVIAVIMSIAGISIAFAALTQILNINGQAKIAGSQWLIEFDDNSLQKNINGQASELTDPTLSGTTLTYNVSLRQPGDYIIYTFDVVNNGTIDAKVDAVPVLSGIPQEYEDDIIYTLTYSGGEIIKVGDELNESESRTLVLTLHFKDTADSVPSEEVLMTLNTSITYIQK